jgi:hypothetical protein
MRHFLFGSIRLGSSCLPLGYDMHINMNIGIGAYYPPIIRAFKQPQAM